MTNEKAEKAIYALIDDYARARETKDTVLLNKILAPEIDQLVSSGTWRIGKKESLDGMMRSSSSNPGKRMLTVDKIRFLDSEYAIVDCRYEIQNPDGTARKMWSTFIVVLIEKYWKITAIRNMLPTRPQ
jgi:uncharacterized protein (TIGR02246 family)